jgi:hypothetical protein
VQSGLAMVRLKGARAMQRCWTGNTRNMSFCGILIYEKQNYAFKSKKKK